MNPRFEAAWELHQFLEQHNITYAIIGGIAATAWGDQRFTRDVDLTIAASLEEGCEPLVHLITTRFPSRTDNPLALARKSRLILVTASNGIDVDISLALPGYEDEVFNRARNYELEPGKAVLICSPEDLIIHKAVAGRPQDIFDIEGVIYRQREKLDPDYIRNWLNQFADILANPEVQAHFETAWDKYLNPGAD
ncbi:MAG: hypothetical protein FJ010_00965 [Chloroflexi bacterium]|nr:hypothetical protein [Chloroflexota bacterium]